MEVLNVVVVLGQLGIAQGLEKAELVVDVPGDRLLHTGHMHQKIRHFGADWLGQVRTGLNQFLRRHVAGALQDVRDGFPDRHNLARPAEGAADVVPVFPWL